MSKPASPLAIPARVTECGADWMQQALLPCFPEARVASVHVQRIAEDIGFGSEIYRCALRGAGIPSSVIVKVWNPTGLAGVAELHFYAELAGGLPLRLPQSYAAVHDAAAPAALLVLEDIAVGWQGNCLQPLAAPGSLELARELAGAHAAYWASPALGATWLRPLLTERPAEWHSERRPRCLERYGPLLGPNLWRVLNDSEQLFAAAQAMLRAAPPTLVHGDLQLDNVLRAAGSGRLVLLDWARCGAGPAALDLADLVFAIALPAERDAVLAAYWEALCAALSQQQPTLARVPLAFDDLRSQLAAALLRSSLVAMLGTVLWRPPTPRGEAIIATTLQRHEAALNWLNREQPALLDQLQ